MIDFITNWWRRYQFQLALKQGNIKLAQQLLSETQRAKVSLTILEKLFQDKVRYEEIVIQNERKAIILHEQIDRNRHVIAALSREKQQFEQFLNVLHSQLKYKEQECVSIQQQLAIQVEEVKIIQRKISRSSLPVFKNLFLEYNFDFICFLERQFKLKEIDENLIQATGIDEEIFLQLELDLVSYLQSEFANYRHQQQLNQHLQATYEKDIVALKQGKDPDYNNYLTPHVYFMVYFLEGVYSAYLSWFLVYQSGLLPTKCNILDIGAGSGAMLYGLNFFLKRASKFLSLPQTHISYCSLEIRNLLQHHGLEFWRQYIEPSQLSTINAYFRLNTLDLFSYGSQDELSKLPAKFFDFVAISHCLFADKERRIQSHRIYKQIFSESLKENGYVLVVVQGRKIFQAYNRRQSESLEREKQVTQMFLDELGLKLKWYKYVTSIGRRVPSLTSTEFARFVKQNLPIAKHMSKLLRKYFDQKYDDSYILDDYIILATKP